MCPFNKQTRKMKRNTPLFTVAAIACLLAMPSYAENRLCVVIYEKQGQTATFDLELRPTVSFMDNDIRLVCGNTDILYPLDSYLKMTIQEADLETSTEHIPDASFSITENGILAHGCNSMELYTVDGKIIAKENAHADGTVTLSTGNLGTGVYLVKVGNKSFKIIRK